MKIVVIFLPQHAPHTFMKPSWEIELPEVAESFCKFRNVLSAHVDVLKLNTKLRGSLAALLVLWQNQKCNFNTSLCNMKTRLWFIYFLLSFLFPTSTWLFMLICVILTKKNNLAPWKTSFFFFCCSSHFKSVCLSICPSTHSRAPRPATSSPVAAPINLPKHMNRPVSFVCRICQMQLTIAAFGTQLKGNSGTTHTKQSQHFRTCM